MADEHTQLVVVDDPVDIVNGSGANGSPIAKEPHGALLGVNRTAILMREAIRLFALGWHGKRVADAIGVGQNTLSKWQSTPEWVEAAERFNTGADETVLSVRQRLELGCFRMLDVLLTVAEDSTNKGGERVNAADSWLDRSGYPRVKVEVGKHRHEFGVEHGFWDKLNAVKAEVVEHRQGGPQ